VNDALDITAVIQQRLAWDIVSCDEIRETWKYLDLVQPSEDVAEVAHLESHKRLRTVEPLALIGDVYITLAADIISKLMAKHFEEQNGCMPTDTERSVMMAQNNEVIRGALFPIIAHLMETGMLQLGPTAYNTQASMRMI
jgi:hypothetical protein